MKKVPMRKCIITNEQFPKNELIRIVLTPENTIEIDETGRKNGRGAYVCKNKEVIEKAMKTKALDRAFKTKIEDSVYEELLNYVQ